MRKFFVGVLLFVMPAVASAASFAQSPIFLSTSPVTEGDTVRVYAIVSNNGTTTFKGTVVISADGEKLGSPSASIAPGGAQTVSTQWSPTAGAHTITAELTANGGTAVQEISQSFSIEAKPKPVQAESAQTVEPSTQIQQSIGSVSPTAQQYSTPIFTVIDSGRTAAADQLTKAARWSKAAQSAPPQVLGASTEKSSAASNATRSIWSFVMGAVTYLLDALLFVVKAAVLFYIIFTALFLYILWWCWRRYRRRY